MRLSGCHRAHDAREASPDTPPTRPPHGAPEAIILGVITHATERSRRTQSQPRSRMLPTVTVLGTATARRCCRERSQRAGWLLCRLQNAPQCTGAPTMATGARRAPSHRSCAPGIGSAAGSRRPYINATCRRCLDVCGGLHVLQVLAAASQGACEACAANRVLRESVRRVGVRQAHICCT